VMTSRKTAAWAMAVILTIAPVLMTAPALTAAPGLTVKGDQQAWTEIVAAFTKQSKVKSYRAKWTDPSVGGGTIEFVSPDRYHVVYGNGQMESFQVGQDIRYRMGHFDYEYDVPSTIALPACG
jgi:hypothetical protein